MTEFFAPDPVPIGTHDKKNAGIEVTCRYCGQRFFAQKGDPLLEDVGLSGVVWTAGENPPGRPLVTAGQTVLVAEEEDGTLQLNLDLRKLPHEARNHRRDVSAPEAEGSVHAQQSFRRDFRGA